VKDITAENNKKPLPCGTTGFAVYTAILFIATGMLPSTAFDPGAKLFIAGIGLLAFWRYSWGLTHFVRSLIYRKRVFPRWRNIVSRNEESLMPSEIYILMTVYRIDVKIAARSICSVITEAMRCKIPVTVVASVVEKQDAQLFEEIWNSLKPSENITLRIVRAAGTGKRTGLAQGFKAISRCLPAWDSVTVVMDGDTVLLPGTLRRCVPFFKFNHRLGALTTDEISELEGTKVMEEWHNMRFAQRHILMGSISLARRVMTLTGRMSMFRTRIVTDPEFIQHIQDDQLDHWRLGRFKFLTGDDKSSLYWVLGKGWEQLYIPDVEVLTMESPPHPSFLKASTQLMRRWFGNMLRTNGRILDLGTSRMPFFVWWSFLDQRISMWTTLAGPIFAVMLSAQYGMIFAAYYIVWAGFIRWVMSLMLLSARREINWRYPFLLYYNQVYGALLKTWIFFRLDAQSWTRQKTKLQRGLGRWEHRWNEWSSHLVHATAVIILVCAVGLASKTVSVPASTLRMLTGQEVEVASLMPAIRLTAPTDPEEQRPSEEQDP